jgi:hypothetical protein
MDCERCLLILEGHGTGPNMPKLISHFCDEATNVCRASGNYGTPFKAGCSVTQGGPLSAKLFNITVDAVVWEWMRLLQKKWEMEMEEEELDELMETLFVILMWMMCK